MWIMAGPKLVTAVLIRKQGHRHTMWKDQVIRLSHSATS